jgi:adenylate cyclase
MADEGFKRKLTAILSADVEGYSRLMAEDEAATVKTLATYREVMTSLIKQHRGRVVDSPGDNILAEFSSVVDAVQCAVAVQNEIQAQNAELPDNRRMEFRIGVNLGDVIDEEDRIYGDGVNIAARLEAMADPGGICVSKTAFDQIETKLPLGYEYLGEQSVKNIPKPVKAYRVLMKPDAAGKVIGEKRFLGRYSRRTAMAALIILVMVVGGLVGWNIYLHQSKKVEPASVEKMAFPLPDKPSIAVLPFVNISDDPKQEFLSDGITEMIITALSKVPNLFVIARNSSFTYKGKAVKVKQVSEELGVRYVLEGSVQRSADRIRITVQLIDALTGHHLWAERYEGDLKDIFALQDEITLKILATIQVKLALRLSVGLDKFFKGKEGLDCYLKIAEGLNYNVRFNIGDNNLARRIAEEAIAMCPEVPSAYYLMACVYSVKYWLGCESPQECIDKAVEMAQKAISLDDSYSQAYGLLGFLYCQKREYDKAIAEGERAVLLNPTDALVIAYYASSLFYAGRPEEAIPLLQKAIRLNPIGSNWYYQALGNAYFATGRLEEAVSEYKKIIHRMPNYISAHTMLAATYSEMGRENDARAEVEEVLRINPRSSLRYRAKILTIYNDKSVRERILYALRKAGLPE